MSSSPCTLLIVFVWVVNFYFLNYYRGMLPLLIYILLLSLFQEERAKLDCNDDV